SRREPDNSATKAELHPCDSRGPEGRDEGRVPGMARVSGDTITRVKNDSVMLGNNVTAAVFRCPPKNSLLPFPHPVITLPL
ncbi:hypothetical protein ABTF05_21915, partial [Acinetobacter baumannii]